MQQDLGEIRNLLQEGLVQPLDSRVECFVCWKRLARVAGREQKDRYVFENIEDLVAIRLSCLY